MAGVAFAIPFLMDRQCHTTFLIAAAAMPLILSRVSDLEIAVAGL